MCEDLHQAKGRHPRGKAAVNTISALEMDFLHKVDMPPSAHGILEYNRFTSCWGKTAQLVKHGDLCSNHLHPCEKRGRWWHIQALQC